MRLPYLVAVCDLLLLSAPIIVAADDIPGPESTAAAALWVQPATTWYGIDGTWSNFAFVVGSPPQIVYLSVATVLSEIWVVETGGCSAVQLCTNARGGVYDIPSSETWRSLGGYQLGPANTGIESNGDYGLETIAFVNQVTHMTTAVDGALIAGINDTNYYQGFFGVGVTQGKFGTNLTNPFISQLAETYGSIPSHSYGYTAGAYYRNTGTTNGTVASLTLGGYDKLRFVPHDTMFSLDPRTRLPKVLLRGISAKVKSIDKAPTNWTSTAQTLLSISDAVTAIIDTSTPYLWMPTAVCDRFAAALNLTWRDDLGVYIFSDGAQYLNYQTDTSLSFTFSVSSYDNTDNFGQPLDVPGVVNITIPSTAFAQLLRYPFKNIIQWGESSIPYFPLKRSTKEINNNQYIIGRMFMQEAYLITRYDSGQFSLHQALFPENASKNYSLEDIARSHDSPYAPYVETPASHGLSTGQTVGIVLSAFAIGSVIGVILWCLCRRRKKTKNSAETVEKNKEDTQSINGDSPRSPVKRMFSIMIGRKRSKKPVAHEVDGNSAQPVEVGADAQHQLFEMPVPPEPVELDSHYVGDEETDIGVESPQQLSEYELVRRKLERQLQGPVPTYSPREELDKPTLDKSMQDVSLVAHHRPAEDPSPVSPTYGNTNSLPDSLPSPLSPHPDWSTRIFDLPSPMTITSASRVPPSTNSDPSCSYSPVSPHSAQTFAPSSVSRSDSNNISPTSPIGSLRIPNPTIQRTPIDPSRVICLGPLPENVQLPHQQPAVPRIITPDGRTVSTGRSLRAPNEAQNRPIRHSRSSRGSSDSLGSNFTVEEENRMQEDVTNYQFTRQPDSSPTRRQPDSSFVQNTAQQDDDNFPRSPRSMERIETGCELVHVPQIAEKRYSWEEHSK
ncbi:aspartic peptidase domain-containing protein [Lasiosphaeris hirsuta]|uniref:Aspartic peptidase domain-containing protein n=1 Tax=Lasiosphaeris hirsuta TaxID=260670 RepID=A0AA40DVG7_9PEZI|nr:aspartic peptidase domain-containing protein [Lasiosphaeris hirsuta]